MSEIVAASPGGLPFAKNALYQGYLGLYTEEVSAQSFYGRYFLHAQEVSTRALHGWGGGGGWGRGLLKVGFN